MDLAALLLTRVLKFSGESDEEWEKWFCRFEAQTEHVDAGNRLSVLVGLLDGVALDTFVALPSKSRKVYADVVKALESRFGRRVGTLQAHAELSQIRQRTTESIESFAARITELSKLAHPDSTDGSAAPEGFRCGRFICGLRDARLQEKLASKNIQTLAEAVRVSKEFEKSRKAVLAMRGQVSDRGDDNNPNEASTSGGVAAVKDEGVVQQDSNRLSVIEDQLRELRETVIAVASTSETASSGVKQRRLARCYRCGMPGHFQRDCQRNARLPQNGRCFGCGGHGHILRDCPTTAATGTKGRPQARGDSVAPFCLCCGQHGHWMPECQHYRGGIPAGAGPGAPGQYHQQRGAAYPEN